MGGQPCPSPWGAGMGCQGASCILATWAAPEMAAAGGS